MDSLITAAGIKVKPIYSQIFAQLLKEINLSEFIEKMTFASSGPVAPSAAAAQDGSSAAPSSKADEKKEEEEKEEEEEDFGFGLFD